MLLFISFQEVVIVLLGYLLIFGSKNVPGLARMLGRTMRQVKDATDEIKRDLNEGANNLTKDFKESTKDFEDFTKKP